MSLWVDKYRPKTFDQLSYHKELSDHLRKIASTGDFPHTLFYGPSGAGKKTRIVALLRELYGVGAEKLKVDERTFVTPSNKKISLSIISSNYHIELNPSDVGIYDRFIVQDLIKDIAQTQQVDTNAKHRFKVIVINEADGLSRDAQAALRRTMEKYMNNIRIIMCCNTTSKIISPIRSRCLLVRIAAPTLDEITDILQSVAKKEAFKLPPILAKRIAEQSDRNLRKALLMLEASKVQNSPLDDKQEVPLTDWEVFIAQVADMIVAEQSPTRLLEVRSKLYELISHCIPASLILKTLAFNLVCKVDGQIQGDVIREAAIYEHRLRLGSKQIFHLEAFVAKIMAIYKRHIMDYLDM